MLEIIDIVIRSIVALFVLFIIAQLLGKKQIANLTLFDYIISLTIGGIAAETIIVLDHPLINGVVALFVFGIMGLLLSYVSLKSHKINHFFNGEPVILFEKGQFLKHNMWKTRINVDKFLEMCRLHDCHDVSEIEYAILETSGDLSILLKEKHKPVTAKDMKVKKQASGFSLQLILDQKIVEENLKEIRKTEKWLLGEIKKRKLKLENISLATIDESEHLEFYQYNKKKKY